ncbi:MAG: YbjQ family protein [Clostridia bacterium]|nr:YbjQ family protein [Clostridia bacterium]MBQ9409561.1 YbjQ family protein [Clostridia bacterium]
MLLYSVDTVPGKNIELMGLVQGSTVQSKHIGKDIMAGFRNIVGGEMKGYTEMLDDARNQAVARMKSQAEMLGADAIIGVRYATSAITQGAAEILAYGTAVKFI